MREICPACGWIYYQQLKLSSAAQIEQNGKILLVQRSTHPWFGYWYLPAGYVEVDESPEIAAVRETREETGLEISVRRLLNAYYFDDDPRGSGLLLVYACEVTGGQLHTTPEVQAFGYFGPEQIPAPLTGAGHSRAISDWTKTAQSVSGR
jgi:ADP-ribose pyrophosphatase YjhB (NUDIX family)